MSEILDQIDSEQLGRWLVEQRWFASKAREVASFNVLEAVEMGDAEEPRMLLAVVEVRFHPGTHELYNVPLGLRHVDESWSEGVVLQAGDRTVYDAMADPVLARRLADALRSGRTIEGADSLWSFSTVDGIAADKELHDVRPIGVEQSNSSIVFGEQLILKVYRRIEPGPNPELELLRFLTTRGFANIARLAGWYQHEGRLVDATLGLLQEFLPGAGDGWSFVLDALARGEGGAVLDELRELGRVTAGMHSALGSDANDPTFAPEEPSMEFVSLILATIDEDIEAVFRDLPHDNPDLAPIAGRGQEVREQLRQLAHVGAGGRVIRTHGDFHLGQCLLTDRGWVILDFEGEPSRSLPERRQKRSPLRDVAGMLRSFAYASSGVELLRDGTSPETWEQEARDAFLAGYFDAIDGRLLPFGQQNVAQLLSIFELEKAVYELRYELNNRPDWVSIPVSGIVRLLEGPDA